MAEGLSRAEVVAEVRRPSTRPGKSAKGKGAKPRKTPATIRTPAGFKVTVEHRRGVDREAMRGALVEALSQLDAQAEAA